ncbi:hypothetical protein NE237_014831 [Protea cynaroides]|uniref:Uncharacterized protein n=1 Tax=Protea cynaroides TaxID=273540 RepID=A0A9Q0QQH5_9MAGN|nr:hypothetical protein NE237_014831 [Protea cynaroides]
MPLKTVRVHRDPPPTVNHPVAGLIQVELSSRFPVALGSPSKVQNPNPCIPPQVSPLQPTTPANCGYSVAISFIQPPSIDPSQFPLSPFNVLSVPTINAGHSVALSKPASSTMAMTSEIGLLTLSTVLPSFNQPNCQDDNSNRSCTPELQIIIFFCSLFLMGFAERGHKPCT